MLVPPPVLMPHSLDSLGIATSAGNQVLNGASSAAWKSNNLALFYPFRMFDWATAYQLLFFVGATSNGNIDVGIYDSQKNLIVSSGSTAMSATVNTVQELNIADTVLAPGDYLLGVVCSTTTGTVFATAIPGGTDEFALTTVPIYQQASALPLPNPCVPVITTEGDPVVVVCGIQFRPTF